MPAARFPAFRRRRSRGVALLLIAVFSIVMLGMIGLATDLGRAYLIRNELQAFADAAAAAAAYELDGTSAGLSRANSVAASGPVTGGAPSNRYNFTLKPVAKVTVGFSAARTGFEPLGSAPLNSRFVRVTAHGDSEVYFLPILGNVPSLLPLEARAVAGQGVQNTIGAGSDPFSPDAHDPSGPDFGFTKGAQYTLKWPPPGQRGKPGNTCAGDAGYAPPNSSSERGYIDVGQGDGNSALHEAIVNRQYYLTYQYLVGSTVNWVQGNKNVEPAMQERFNQDTDTTAATYGAYAGNGRRILIVPVNDGGDPAKVAGFAAFFMPPGVCGPKNISPCCGEYIGAAVIGSRYPGPGGGVSGPGSGAGLYAVKLFE